MKKQFLTALMALLFATGLTAQEGEFDETDSLLENPETEEEAAYNLTPPPGLESKSPLAEKDLAKKKEGGYFTGLPLLNSDADTGVGYGARVYYYQNKDRSDPFFAYSPYRHRLYAQYFRTTGGWEYHTIDWDAPYFMDTLYRVRTSLIYDKYAAMKFFGIGESTLGNLTGPRTGNKYETFADYNDELRKVVGGSSYARYNQYEYEKPSLRVSVEREILGGLIRPLAGLRIQKVNISDYSGDTIDVDGTEAVSEKTLLKTLNEAGEIEGFDGGWNNQLIAGIAYDTRDFEPDPNSGVFVDLTTELSTKGLGSDFDYQRYTFSPRVYYSPIPEIADLVLAARGAYSVVEGDVPFYAYNTLAFTSGNRDGLGGYRTLRGFSNNRFVGKVMTLANFEIRWTMFDIDVAGQNFAFMLVPFVDAGRVFDKTEDVSLNGWKYSYGSGLRIPWNQQTIIFVDYGVSEEGAGLYINFEHIF